MVLYNFQFVNKKIFLHFYVLKIILPAGGIVVNKTIPGIEVFISNHTQTASGKRVALLTNPTGIDSKMNSSIDILKKEINLTALLSPEHGVRGNFQAGENVPDHKDERFDLPSFSLYDQSKSSPVLNRSGTDARMRNFDTSNSGKILEKKILEKFDLIFIDIQDIGTRIYTYISTMAHLMNSSLESGIQIVITDRPNPITGKSIEGPVLEFPEFSSFVGIYSIPVRHGMTIGELALFFNKHMFDGKVNLAVIPMKNWERDMWFDETLLPWMNPSPNIPTITTASVYPGMVFFEGTNISEGRGTTKPFELIGAPWINGFKLAAGLNNSNLNGIRFKETFFKPWFSKYSGEMCSGIQLIITDREKFKPYITMLYILTEIIRIYPDEFSFYENYFDKITGNSWVRKMLTKGKDPQDIIVKYMEKLEEFKIEREEFLLYKS